MAAHQLQTWPEPTTVAGEILISQNHIALLHGLYDRPGSTAASRAEWVRASMRYASRFRQFPSESGLSLAAGRVHPCWVRQVRRGRPIKVCLTERGRAIVERLIPVRIRGWGPYTGMQAINGNDQSAPANDGHAALISVDFMREAVAYSNVYGIPLLDREIENETDLTVYAVTPGLDGSFKLVTREELALCGPRRWHAIWTRVQLDRGYVPARYQEQFADYDREDVLFYLRELASTNRDKDLYCHTYAGRQFLSVKKFDEWLSEEIDFRQTDIDAGDVITLIRAVSPTHSRLAAAVSAAEALSWTNPETGESVGRVFIDPDGTADLVTSSCAALSGFQWYCGSRRLGIRIETRYVVGMAKQ